MSKVMLIIIRLLCRVLPLYEFRSRSLRLYWLKKYGVRIGMHSYGCFDVRRWPGGTIIGRYCSIAPTSYRFNANHPMDEISMHPYWYRLLDHRLKVRPLPRTECRIGDGAWIGHGVVLLPRVAEVGRGAVVGAGSVVTKNVPPYSIVVGNPAKVVAYRFSDEVIDRLESDCWWNMSPIELQRYGSIC